MRAVCLLVLVCAVGCGGKKDDATTGGGDPKSKAAEEKSPVSGVVDLQVLAHSYRTNEAGAEQTYTARRMTCEGFMHKLEKLDSGAWMMSFEYFVDGFNMRKGIVYAYFPASAGPSLTKFEYRSPVHFNGRCDGWDRKVVPAIVAIRDCKIVPPPKVISAATKGDEKSEPKPEPSKVDDKKDEKKDPVPKPK